jgi:uncharacterized membrane protein
MANQEKKRVFYLKILLVIGMLLALFLVYEHFSPSASKFCTFGANFDCGVVNKSPYANLDGLSYLLTIDYGLNLPLVDISGINTFFDFVTSNAFLGFLTLLFLFGLVHAYEKKKGFWWVQKKQVVSWIKGLLVFGILYGLYLFYIQHSLLQMYCIFCLGLDVTLVLLCIIAWRLK